MTMNAYRHVLDTVIHDAKSKKTKPRDRVTIMKFLDEQLDKLWEQVLMTEQTKEVDTVSLSGPRQIKAKSQLSASQGKRESIPREDDTPS